MSEVYIEYQFFISPLQPASEILIAELALVGFESFVENEEGVLAYIQENEHQENILNDIDCLKSEAFSITYQLKEIPKENWNINWESNFSPIEVSPICAVRAPFHKPFNVPFEIVIEPKMSFGTGHHETTFMMMQFILENNFENKTVLDMGCGTSVLAILAEKRGATKIDAIDIDAWCVENSIENIERNQCNNINVKEGTANRLPKTPTYHTIIANINRNILLDDLKVYTAALKKGGEIYVSGFYDKDLIDIKACCNNLGLNYVENKENNNWIAAKFINL